MPVLPVTKGHEVQKIVLQKMCAFSVEMLQAIVVCTKQPHSWPFNQRLGGVNPRRELLRVGKGLLGLRSPVARGNWSGHVR